MSDSTEYEAALRRAFVDRSADYIVITSRRERFQIEAANFGVERGWVAGRWDDRDEQSTAWVGRLTPDGRKHFGLPAPAGG